MGETKSSNPLLGKAEAQDRRNEKLAGKNPDRIQKQIDDLKAIATQGGKLSKHEEQVIEGLEKDLKAVKKAREALGDKAPTLNDRGGGFRDRDGGSGAGRGGRGGGNQGVLGKRRRDGQHEDWSVSDEDVPEEIRSIPMPRDTPPPIAKEVMDEWHAKRRARWAAENPERAAEQAEQKQRRAQGEEIDENPRGRPLPQAKTVYSAAPVTRDLRKEAVAAFVPTAVKMKMDKGQGKGALMEPEEADRLEQEGYLKTSKAAGEDSETTDHHPRTVTMEDVDEDEDEG